MRCAAISIAFARTTAHALRHELPAITAVPLPPVPRPNAVDRAVALHDRDVVELDAELLGDDLRHRRLDALAVRAGTERDGHLPARVHAHDRGLGAHRVHHPGARLDVEPEPDAEEPAVLGERALLFGAERVVADDLGGLFERLRRAHHVERQSGRQRVRQLGRSGCTLRRRHSSGSMPIARAAASTICSRATVSNIHGPRYAPRPHVLVHTARVRSDATRALVRTGEQQPDEADRRRRCAPTGNEPASSR